MARKSRKMQYVARSGAKQWKPSIEYAMALSENYEGFCLACGKTQSCVEPDARRYECESCGAAKVYGAEELVLMGLVF